ncbi:MAG: PH domain-containing protein [Bacillota bacterium]
MPKSERVCLATEEKFALAPADLETRIALLLLIIPLGVLSLVGVAVGISDPAELPESLTGLGIVALIAVSLVAVHLAFAPAAYILDAQGIRIARRFARPVYVPYARVRNVALRRFPGPPFAIVRLGSYPPWGLFGYFGRFKVERLGWIRVYATSWKNEMVVLETEREPYFLSPAEPQRFYEALRARQVTGLLVG